MTLHPVTYYRITCDWPGCKAETGSVGWAEPSAYADAADALDDWCDDGDGVEAGCKHYCADHHPVTEDG